MAKIKNEIEKLKQECDTLKTKINELTQEELMIVCGGEYRDKEGHIHFCWPGQTDEKDIDVGGSIGPNIIFTPTEDNKYPEKD